MYIVTHLALVPLSFLLSYSVVYLIKKSLSSHLLDIPNERSSHTQPTPRGGGLGFVLSFLLISTTYSWIFPEINSNLNVSHLWLTVLPLAFISLLDDRGHIPAWLRYLVHIVSASLAISFFGIFPQPWLVNLGTMGVTIAVLLTLVAITAMINFYNFMDGLDGLVAGVTIIQLVFAAIVSNQPLWLLLAVSICGFLWWNWAPAKIFMGDVGSTFLGAIIAVSLLDYSRGVTTMQAWSALTITLPIVADATYTLICRIRRGENIFQSHRSHLYQRLQISGWTHSQVAINYMIFTSAIALNIYIFSSIGAWINLLITIAAIVTLEIYLKKPTPHYSHHKFSTEDSKTDDYTSF